MAMFRVMVEGSNVCLFMRRWFRRRRMNCGFFTTRWVTADDDSAAIAQAFDLVRAELREQGVHPFEGEEIALQVEAIVELASFEGARVPGRGFSFFPAGS